MPPCRVKLSPHRASVSNCLYERETKVTYGCEEYYYTKLIIKILYNKLRRPQKPKEFAELWFGCVLKFLKLTVEMSNAKLDFLPQIDPIKCIGCELCVKICSNQALAMDNNNIAVVANPQDCNYEAACQEICPSQAISLTYEIIF